MFRDAEKILPKEHIQDDRRFVRAALEAMKGNNEREKVNAWKNAAVARLRERYGIDNLNNIEKVHLSKLTERILEEQHAQMERCDMLWEQGDEIGYQIAAMALFGEIEKEIADRWLWETLGVDRDKIPGGIVDDVFKEYLKRIREEGYLL